MSDKEYYEQLCSNSIDGTLTDSEREKLEAHLAECPSCAALKQDLEQMHALFSTEAALPDGLHEKIMQCVEQEAKLRVVQPEKPARRLPVFTMVAAAAVVVLAVLGGGVGQVFGMVNMGAGVSASNASTAAGATEGLDMNGGVRAAVEDAADQAALAKEEKAADASADAGEAPPAEPAAPESYSVPESGAENPAGEDGGDHADTAVPAGGGAVEPRDSGPAVMQAGGETEAFSLPEALSGVSVAHCYLASGTGELPDIGGELLSTDETVSYFLLDNSMATIQDTFKALEEAGFEVSAYEGLGLTLDSKAESWLLIGTVG